MYTVTKRATSMLVSTTSYLGKPSRALPIIVACDSYHLPEHVQPHVDFVTPTVHFDAKIFKRSGSGSTDGVGRSIGQPGSGAHPKTTGQIQTLLNELEACDQQITPICLRALYELVYEPLAASKNSYGIGKYKLQTICT